MKEDESTSLIWVNIRSLKCRSSRHLAHEGTAGKSKIKMRPSAWSQKLPALSLGVSGTQSMMLDDRRHMLR